MSSIAFILRKSLKNNILELLKHPGKLVAYLFIVACLLFSALSMALAPQEEMPAYLDIRILQGIYFALLMFVVMINLIKGVDSGSTFFSMGDVNMLFISPISPKKILIYGLAKQMGMTVLIACCMVAYGGMAVQFFGISVLDAVLLFAGFIVSLLVAQIFTILIYSFCNGNRKRSAAIKRLLYVVVVLVLAYVAMSVYQKGFSAETVYAAVTDPYLQWVPIVGWMSGGIFSLIRGFDIMGIVYFALLAAATVFALLAFLKSDSDYYEDVLQNTETTYEIKKAAKEGNINMNMPGQKIRKVKKVGIGHGWGASAFFFKQVKELHRHSPLVFWGGSTIMLAAVGAFISVVMMNAGDDGEPMSANLIMMIATITLIYVLFFLNAAGPWSKEMMKPYLYMVPQSPFKKLFFASLTSLLTPIADGIVVFPLIGILVKASPLTVIICFLMFISFGFLYTALNILSERLFGQMANKGLILMLYALVLMVCTAPGVVIGIVLGVALHASPFVMGLPVFLWNTGVSALVYFLCKETIGNIELKA